MTRLLTSNREAVVVRTAQDGYGIGNAEVELKLLALAGGDFELRYSIREDPKPRLVGRPE